MTTPADELIDIEEKDIYASIKKKRNWSLPGNYKVTNYWLKTLSTTHKGLAKAVSKIINSDIPLPDWLVEGKCVMIPKKENPLAKDHRPITLLNTMYKTITSVIDGQLKEHQVIHQYMQIDQRGCTTNSKQQLCRIRNRTSERSERVRFLIQNNECVNTVQSTFHVVLCLLYTY